MAEIAEPISALRRINPQVESFSACTSRVARNNAGTLSVSFIKKPRNGALTAVRKSGQAPRFSLSRPALSIDRRVAPEVEKRVSGEVALQTVQGILIKRGESPHVHGVDDRQPAGNGKPGGHPGIGQSLCHGGSNAGFLRLEASFQAMAPLFACSFLPPQMRSEK